MIQIGTMLDIYCPQSSQIGHISGDCFEWIEFSKSTCFPSRCLYWCCCKYVYDTLTWTVFGISGSESVDKRISQLMIVVINLLMNNCRWMINWLICWWIPMMINLNDNGDWFTNKIIIIASMIDNNNRSDCSAVTAVETFMICLKCLTFVRCLTYNLMIRMTCILLVCFK